MDLTALVNIGAVGCVLLWFMLRSEPRMTKIEEAIDRLNRGQMLFLLAVPDISKKVREAADEIIAELDEATKQRK